MGEAMNEKLVEMFPPPFDYICIESTGEQNTDKSQASGESEIRAS
jgi:hypothetical protein